MDSREPEPEEAAGPSLVHQLLLSNPTPAACAPSLQILKFELAIPDAPAFVQVIVLSGALHVWVGNKPTLLGSLDVSFPTKLADTGGVTTSALLGFQLDSPGAAVSSKLAVRLQQPVFLSWGHPVTKPGYRRLVEEGILRELTSRLPPLPVR